MNQTTVAKSLAQQIGVMQVSRDEFVSATFPKRLGNTKPIAYGGCSRAVTINAAPKTVERWLQSLLGAWIFPRARTR